MTGARDKLLLHVHGSWRKQREMVLSPNNEEVANSSKQHTQFKDWSAHTLFQTKMVEIDTLFQTKTAKKTYPLARHIPKFQRG